MRSNLFKILKDSYLFKKIESFYGKIIHVLFLGKWMSRILAYGGLHIALLFALGIQAYIMWKDLNKNNVTSFNQIIYRFYGDTLQNYNLNYLNFEKDMRRRNGDIHNEKDIVFYYGFQKKDTTNRKPNVSTIYIEGGIKQNTDLVAKVRYLTCNDLPDTIDYKRRNQFEKSSKNIKKIVFLSNHERYYYDSPTTDDSIHIFKHTTHAKDRLIEWNSDIPCFSFWLGFIIDNCSELNDKSIIKIKFNDYCKDVNKDGYRRPLIVDKVFPKPTEFSLNEIVYKGEELKAVIKQRGIYISGIDPEKEEIVEKKNLFSTVLLGTIIAFMLDIMVQLVLKWRKLKDYK